MKTLFMDLDDTVKDTDRYILRYIQCNNFIPGFKGSSYNLIGTENEHLVSNVLDNWDVIPFKEGAMNGINLLKTEYNIEFVSGYTTFEEAKKKYLFAYKMGCGIKLVTGSKWDKSHIDMSGGIFVDDRSDILIHSNADYKYEMYNPIRFSITAPRDDRTVVVDWFSLIDLLIEGNQEGANYENIRRIVCPGI